METLPQNCEPKMKTDIKQRVQNLQLRWRKVVRHMLELSGNVENQLCDHLENLSFSLELDESTDIKDIAQLLFCIRFVLTDL